MPKENTTLVNGLSPVTKESGGTVAGFPDVCKAPGPGGPIPVPFPNIAKSEDLEDGSRSVTIGGAPVALSTSRLARSTGNEAATAGGGVSSEKTCGAAHPVTYSFDVLIEGKPVVRNRDLFTLNDRNTAPFPIMQSQVAPATPVRVDDVPAPVPEERCRYCKKAKHDIDKAGRTGSNLGNSAVLGRNMLDGRELATHPWYAGPFSLAAHHLICLEAMEDEHWAHLCYFYAYHIDRRPNGVFLPMKMGIACQLAVAVHRGNHAEGYAFDLDLAYPDAVKAKLADIAAAVAAGRFCANPAALIEKLDALSRMILARVSTFQWTLTRDGLDYAPGGLGCCGLKSIRQKPTGAPCPRQRRHGAQHAVTRQVLRTRPMTVGG
ncbi:PAAR-like domain-containing protein [Pyxidicoccus sp. 3LG]